MTFHGFRYAEVEGWPVETAGELTAESLEAVVVHSDLERTGFFECSEPLLNQLHQNVVWGTKGNFVDLPTDCPQRDERLGWTGDIAAFAPTAAYLFDVGPFLADWLVDLALEQEHADGMVAFVVPDVLKLQPHPAEFPDPDSTAIWSDAAVWVPWSLWQAYGDRSVLRASVRLAWPPTCAASRPCCPPPGSGTARSSSVTGSTPTPRRTSRGRPRPTPAWSPPPACYRSATIVAETARLLGRDADADEFAALAASDRGRRSTSTTWQTTAWCGPTAPPSTRSPSSSTCSTTRTSSSPASGSPSSSTESDYRVSTGFAGTPYITDALTRTGHLDDAYRLLLERECPSWLYPVTMGATTIWERWDSMLPDGSINPGEMTSFNHYALGAVADWMHRTIGGLVATEPGYRSVRIAPRPGGGLTWASTALETAHGRIEVSWRLEDSVARGRHGRPRGCRRRSSPWTAVTDGPGPGRPFHPSGRPSRERLVRRPASALLDLEGKVRLLSARAFFTLHGDASIGLQPMAFSDGPTGVRGVRVRRGPREPAPERDAARGLVERGDRARGRGDPGRGGRTPADPRRAGPHDQPAPVDRWADACSRRTPRTRSSPAGWLRRTSAACRSAGSAPA